MADIPKYIESRLDLAVVEALEKKTNQDNIWDYLNWLIAADLIGPDYVPEDKKRNRKKDSKITAMFDKQVYDAWIDHGTPTIRALANRLGMKEGTVYSRLTRYLADKPSEKNLLSSLRGKDPKQRQEYLDGYQEN